ncbi:MAG: hypothetical protein RBT34_01705 [Anaerolineaceae bacterium]|jgi:hypothetical protein|nr:hypothetical protein [Anaerolineaceae bacterium]
MDHIVYVDAKENDLEKILDSTKQMIIRGAAGRKLPHGRVDPGDSLYFIENNGDGLVKACASVTSVVNSDKLSKEESQQMVAEHMQKLQLTQAQMKRWAGKRYLVLVSIENAKPLEPFSIDRSEYGNMDDWLPVGEIERVRIG